MKEWFCKVCGGKHPNYYCIGQPTQPKPDELIDLGAMSAQIQAALPKPAGEVSDKRKRELTINQFRDRQSEAYLAVCAERDQLKADLQAIGQTPESARSILAANETNRKALVENASLKEEIVALREGFGHFEKGETPLGQVFEKANAIRDARLKGER